MTELKSWKQSKQEASKQRRIKEEIKLQKANKEKEKLQVRHRQKAIHNLVRWDEYRIRRDAAIIVLHREKYHAARLKAWCLLSSFHAVIAQAWR